MYALLYDITGNARTDYILRDTDGTCISADPANPDWVAYQAWRAGGNTPTAKVVPLPNPSDISDRQFAMGLWSAGIISYQDFLGFIGPGTIPAAIQAIVNTLADDSTGAPTPQKVAIGFLTGSKLYQFGNPLVETFRIAMAANDPKWTPSYLRAQWLTWGTL